MPPTRWARAPPQLPCPAGGGPGGLPASHPTRSQVTSSRLPPSPSPRSFVTASRGSAARCCRSFPITPPFSSPRLRAAPRPGLLAMLASLVVVWSEFPAPWLSFGPITREESVGLALYVFASLLTVWLAENHRHAWRGDDLPQPAVLQWATPILVAFAAVLLTTLVLLAVDSYLAPDHLVLGYLLPTVVIAMHYGSTLAVITSFAGGIAATYFLFPPKLSFFIADPLRVGELGFFCCSRSLRARRSPSSPTTSACAIPVMCAVIPGRGRNAESPESSNLQRS